MSLQFIKDLSGYNGEAKLYQNETTEEFFVVSRAYTFDRGDETMIFASDSEGNVTDWVDLYAGYGVNHEDAVKEFELDRK